MLKYLQIMKTSFLNRSYYRFELLFDATKSVVVVVVICAIWREIYRGTDQVDGYSYSQIVTYTCVAALLTLLFNLDVARYMSSKIRRGDIAVELIKPVDFILFTFSEHLGWVLYSLLFCVLPTSLVLLAAFPTSPSSASAWALALLLAVPGFLIYYLFSHLCALATFFTVDAWGIEYFRVNLIRFFAGGFLPVSFFPEPLRAVTEVLPFPYMIYAPAAAACGQLPVAAATRVIGIQFVWVGALALLNQGLWLRVVRRVTVHGG